MKHNIEDGLIEKEEECYTEREENEMKEVGWERKK